MEKSEGVSGTIETHGGRYRRAASVRLPEASDWFSGGLLACAAVLAAVLALGCSACTPAAEGVPAPYILSSSGLCACSALLYAASAARRRSVYRTAAYLVSTLAFSGVILASLHAQVLQVSFCRLCLTYWALLGASVCVQRPTFRLAPWFVASLLLFVATAQVVMAGSGLTAVLDRRAAKGVLASLGFEYDRSVRAKPGDRLRSSALASFTGNALFLTKCSDCAARSSRMLLRRLGIKPGELLLVAADASTDWKTPEGYAMARRVISMEGWKAVGPQVTGRPALIIADSGVVKEVLQ